ncbi:MAG: beta-lactamase domain protein [Firmicutes bacterium]|nr:beta-lactamase domain protein [Bacillota bacterium]
MDNIVEVTGGPGGSAFLVMGREKTALLDCGMAYCAPKLFENLSKVLKNRMLDYLFISHSHYDHIGAIPYIKTKWPNAKLLGAEHARKILTRPTALATIRTLGREAANCYGADDIDDYEDKLLQVDECIGDGDTFELGGVSIDVVRTTGHTQCSLSFLINKNTLFASESTGCMSRSGKIYPAFITSSAEALQSIAICQQLQPAVIISPHYGFVSHIEVPAYWDNCRAAIKETRDFIIAEADCGYEEEQILLAYEQRFRDEQSRVEQPLAAFQLNTRFMIKTVLKESGRQKIDEAG